MSFNKLQVLGEVRRCKDIPAAQRLVVEAIIDTADPNTGRKAWRSNAKLCEELGVSEDTCTRARKAAVRLGILVPTFMPKRGSWRTAEYDVTHPKLSAGEKYSDPELPAAEKYSNPQPSAAEVSTIRKTTPKVSAAEGTPSVTTSAITSGSSDDTPTTFIPVLENEDPNRFAGIEKTASDAEPMLLADTIEPNSEPVENKDDPWETALPAQTSPDVCGVCGIDPDDRHGQPEGVPGIWLESDGTVYHEACKPGPETRRRERAAAATSDCPNCQKWRDRCFKHGSKKLAPVGGYGDYRDDECPW